MIKKLTPEKLKRGLEELLDWDALEMQVQTDENGEQEVLIPYLMNDAAECYYRLKDTVVHGQSPENAPFRSAENTEIDLEEGGNRTGILIRQNGRTVSLWYRDAFREMHCYRYHRIGHNWRKSREGENIRRLVNLLCVLSDKNQYLGSSACSEQEQRLIPLIEFAPLCAWSPISDSLLDWYPETEEGIQAMTDLVSEIGDTEYLSLLASYRELSLSGNAAANLSKKQLKLREQLFSRLSRMLGLPEHACIWQEIERRLTESSLLWEERKYPAEKIEKMNTLRKKKEQEYLGKGYEGTYPLMQRPSDRKECVLFVEEHPFTVLEAEEYQFQIFELFR